MPFNPSPMTSNSPTEERQQWVVKRTEKGWPGHFCVAASCLFRRHTMLEYADIVIGVSTVGNYRPNYGKREEIEEIGYHRYFETMAFHGEPATEENPWRDPDVSRQISFNSEWAISEPWKEQQANDMHEAVVAEITAALLAGNTYSTTD
jgi:hypothetical protein